MRVSGNYFPGGQRYYRAALTAMQRGRVVFPKFLDIQPSPNCNLKCDWCIGKEVGGEKPEHQMFIENFGLILDNAIVKDNPPDAVHFAGCTGDPMFDRTQKHRSPGVTDTALPSASSHLIFDRISSLGSRGPRISLITNGLSLSDGFRIALPYFQSVQISLDAGNATDFKRLKGVNGFGRVMGNIRRLGKWMNKDNLFTLRDRDTTFMRNSFADPKLTNLLAQDHLASMYGAKTLPLQQLTVNFVLVPENLTGITPAFIDRLISYGVNRVGFRIDMNRRNDQAFQALVQEKMRSVLERTYPDGFMVVLKSPSEPIQESSFERCLSRWLWPAIGPDGQVYPCAHTVSPKFAMGSLWEKSLEEIWMEQQQTSLHEKPPCKSQCPSTAGSINLLGQQIFHLAAVAA